MHDIPLNDTKRIFADKNHNLVYKFLHEKNLPASEYYDIVIFGYLRAVQRYLTDPNLAGYSFDETADRYDIRFDIADYYGGLHCGECMDVFTGGKWKPTRIEYGDNWYLVGIRAEDLNGLRVRI